MSDTVLVAIIGVVSSLLTSVVAVIPTIIANRKKTQASLMETVKDTNRRIDQLTADFIKYKSEDEDRWAQETRVRFLNFNDSLCDASRPWPSKGTFEQALKDCDDYQTYIESHDGFRNGIGELAIENIRAQYSECQGHQLFGKAKA